MALTERTPGIAATRSRAARKSALRFSAGLYSGPVAFTVMLSRLWGSKPESMALSFHRLRMVRPAPESSMSEMATSAITSAPRSEVRVAPAEPRPPSFNAELRSGREN